VVYPDPAWPRCCTVSHLEYAGWHPVHRPYALTYTCQWHLQAPVSASTGVFDECTFKESMMMELNNSIQHTEAKIKNDILTTPNI
jgi:hypothetical protein